MPSRISVQGLQVDPALHDFVEREALPGSGASSRDVWLGLARMARDFGLRRTLLLERRAALQEKIDLWLRAREAPPDEAEQEAFLRSIGYLEREEPHFEISPPGVDPEFARIAAPHFIVPLDDARGLTQGLNARWGDLMRILYATDAVSPAPAEPAAPLDPARLERVRIWLRGFLDEIAPLERGRSHAGAAAYRIGPDEALRALMADGSEAALASPEKCVGWSGPNERPDSLLLRNNDLHLELRFAPGHPWAEGDPTGLCGVEAEGALTLLGDLEDLCCVADAEDKLRGYRNWLALAQGRLETPASSCGPSMALAPDRIWRAPGGASLRLRGRALAMARTSGLAPVLPAVLTAEGAEYPELMLDVMILALCGAHDLPRARGDREIRNSETGSIYLALPKLHAPDECVLVAEIFARVEEALRLPPLTLKIGLMVEERRLALNLKSAMAPLRRRLALMSSGLLDRCAGEIRACSEAGPVLPLRELKIARWRRAYERHIVDMAVETGFAGRAKIERSGWSRPRRMTDLLTRRIAEADGGGATGMTAFSPAIATLMATQYHRSDPRGRQTTLGVLGRRAPMAEMLRPPLAEAPGWSPEEIRAEVEENARVLTHYAEGWIRRGAAFPLRRSAAHEERFEDFAAMRIAALHLANWLRHEVASEAEVSAAFDRAEADLLRRFPGEEAEISATRDAAAERVREALADPDGYALGHARMRALRRAAKAGALAAPRPGPA